MSASVQRLRGIVGASKALYLQVVGVMRAHYAEHGDPSMCALRSQLLMACHDAELTDLCAPDRATGWRLADACVRDACLDGRRVSEMCAIVKQLTDSRAGEREAAKAREKEAKKAKKEATQKTGGSGTRSKGLPALKVTFGMKKKPVEPQPADGAGEPGKTEPTASPALDAPADRNVKKSDELDASEGAPVTREDSDAPAGSMSRAEAGFSAGARENRNPLAGVGMILRDPPVTHLLLHETCRTLEETVRAELVPKREKRLKDLTDLLAVALESRKMVRDARPSLPAAPAAAMSEFYPILAEMLLESQAREAEGDLGEEEEEAVTAPAETRGADADAARDDGEAEDGAIADVSADARRRGAGLEKRNVDADADEPTGRVAMLARLMRSSDVIRKVALTHAPRRVRAGDTRGARPILAAAAAGSARPGGRGALRRDPRPAAMLPVRREPSVRERTERARRESRVGRRRLATTDESRVAAARREPRATDRALDA